MNEINGSGGFTDNNNGKFSAKQQKGHTGKGATLISTGTKGRGKLYISGIRVPVGAAIRIRLWAKTENYLGGTWVNLEGLGAKKPCEF